jgi:hypothetical protein
MSVYGSPVGNSVRSGSRVLWPALWVKMSQGTSRSREAREQRPRHVLLVRQVTVPDRRRVLDGELDRRRLSPDEERPRSDQVAVDHGVVDADVVPCYPPAPRLTAARLAEDRHPVLLRVAHHEDDLFAALFELAQDPLELAGLVHLVGRPLVQRGGDEVHDPLLLVVGHVQQAHPDAWPWLAWQPVPDEPLVAELAV